MDESLARASVAPTNILIVDDLPEKHLVFASILEELGQNLVMVRSGREALRCVLESEFAVILLDVNMPDIDGFETATMLRRFKKTAHTPILFITAYVDNFEVSRGYALGAVDYIASPVVPEILRSKVRVFVELHQKTQQLRAYAEEREALGRAEAARLAAEAASERADFLSQAGRRLGRSLDLKKTAVELLELTVPRFASYGLLALVDASGDPLVVNTAAQIGQTTMAADAQSMWGDLGDAERHLIKFEGQDVQVASGAVLHGLVHRTLCAQPNEPPSPEAMAFPFEVGNHMRGVFVLGQYGGIAWAVAQTALMREVIGRAAIAFENAALYRSIQEEDRRKNEFLAMLAHELRNPMAPIANAVHVLRSLSLDHPTVSWASDLIGRQVAHMARMVDDLLDVSRIARGTISIQRMPVTLEDLLAGTEEATKPILTARSQTLIVDPLPEGVSLNGDIVRLAQALSNLVQNASKFSEPGSEILIRTCYTPGNVAISVVDQGVGIDQSFLPRAFDLFAQDSQTLDRSHGGLGIGLTLVKHLVELHGGTITAMSAGPNLGSTFAINLPAAQTVTAGLSATVPLAQPRSASPARVLVVEDQEDSANTLKMVLVLEGHEVELAANGSDALTRFRTFRPDVVVMDLGLPGMTGFEVARKMRSFKGKQPLLVALTGYGQAEDMVQSMDSGFDHHVVKPADIEKLLSLIEGRVSYRPTAVIGT